ncbi:MAG: B12-binding domain-containing radical SAM protein [Myxococcota bacterium]
MSLKTASTPLTYLVKVPCYSDVVSPPLGLGYLAAHVGDVARVRLIDGIRKPVTPRSLAALARKEQPTVIGLSVVTHAARALVDFVAELRAACPDSLIVAGGPHPSAMSELVLRRSFDGLDAVMIGEAERTFRGLVIAADAAESPRSVDLSALPGVAYLDADEYVKTPQPAPVDIDELGMPAWSLMPPDSYPHAPHGAFFKRFPVAPILTSRGCPYACGFCSVPQLVGRKMRYRSPEVVCDELQILRDSFGVREFQVVDDNFTISRKHALGICREIIARGLVMPWSCPNGVRIDALDDELLDAMQAAGCYSISLGIESGSARVLERMVKHLDLSIVPEVVDKIVGRGMEAHAFFILGYPGETRGEALETIHLAESLPLTRANFSLFTPLPSTPEFDTLSRNQRERILNMSDYAEVSYVAPGYSPRVLKNLQRQAILRFYSRPRQLWRLARAIRSPETAFYVGRRALHWLGGR